MYKNYFNNYNNTWTGCITVITTIIVITAITNTFIWLLWNNLMPTIFKLPSITWLQTLGLYILFQLIFRITINYNNKKS